jgi:hypothetical protein
MRKGFRSRYSDAQLVSMGGGGGDGGRDGGILNAEGGAYQAETDRAREPQVLRITLDLRVREEERHRDQRAYDHRAAAAPEVFGFAHEPCQDGAGDGAEVGDGVVAPDLAVGEAAELGAAGADVDWEEDVVEGVGEAY